VAEGGGLLNRYTVNSRIVGSNPIPSAILLFISKRYEAYGDLYHSIAHSWCFEPFCAPTSRSYGRGGARDEIERVALCGHLVDKGDDRHRRKRQTSSRPRRVCGSAP
jgi:hypothetical protein